jgi:4-alpha-glucanotransferase
MSDDTGPNLPPFPSSYRASGLLLHVTSLPSRYGIGDVGPAAIAWIDQLSEAGQSWWQALPLAPTGYGNSPYLSNDLQDSQRRAQQLDPNFGGAVARDGDGVDLPAGFAQERALLPARPAVCLLAGRYRLDSRRAGPWCSSWRQFLNY